MSRRWIRLFQTGIAILLIVNLASCGIKPKIATTPVKERAVKLNKGDTAPWSGWLIDDDTFSFLYKEATRGVRLE